MKNEIFNYQEFLDDLYNFKKDIKLTEEEDKEINKFIDNIAVRIQELNKKLSKSNIEKLAKTIEIILTEDENG